MSAKKFFRELYLPPLIKAGNREAITLAKTIKARGARDPKCSTRFDQLPPEEHRRLSSQGGANRWSGLTPEEKRNDQLAIVGRLHAAQRAKPKKERARVASIGGAASWAALTPEKRAARIARLLEAGARSRLARRTPEWPFPEGDKKPRLQGEVFAEKMRAAREAKERLRKFLNRTTPKGP